MAKALKDACDGHMKVKPEVKAALDLEAQGLTRDNAFWAIRELRLRGIHLPEPVVLSVAQAVRDDRDKEKPLTDLRQYEVNY